MVMPKTNPIGVRFREDILEKLKTDHGIDSPQKGLVFLERFYVEHHKVAKDYAAILRNTPNKAQEKAKYPLTEQECIQKETPEIGLNGTPKTLDQLKALCPKELTGFDRSDWIRTERQKYGI